MSSCCGLYRWSSICAKERSDSHRKPGGVKSAHLVDGRDNPGRRKNLFERLFGEVRDTDSADLALELHLLHLPPGLCERDTVVDITRTVRESGVEDVVSVGVQRHRPVDEVD